MAMSDIVTGAMFNCETDVTFTKPKVNNSGGKNIGILNAHTKKSLYISSPLMLTWGVNQYTDEKTGKVTYDMSLQFPKSEYNTEELSNFLKAMQGLEEKIKSTAIDNSKEWMNKAKMSKEVVDALWSPMLKYPKDQSTGEPDYSRAPTLRVKVPFWEGEFKNVEVYDINQNPLFPNDGDVSMTELIVKGSNVATIIQCGGIWFANGKFGVTWKLFQCVVKPRETLSGRCHIQLSATERTKMEVSSDTEEGPSKTTNTVDDSDDEENEAVDVSEAPVPEPEPEPVVQKKVEADDLVEKPKKKVVKKVKKPTASAEE
tara:strand:- start:49 stop:993 length:945 start_codon:yes stop_codon:yes gene_type:complete